MRIVPKSSPVKFWLIVTVEPRMGPSVVALFGMTIPFVA